MTKVENKNYSSIFISPFTAHPSGQQNALCWKHKYLPQSLHVYWVSLEIFYVQQITQRFRVLILLEVVFIDSSFWEKSSLYR